MDDPQNTSSGASSRGQADTRLDSWKKIASYLKRDVRTVQRWERREAMPVHRHLHDKLGSVFAFRSELDAWWESRRTRLAQEGANEGEQAVQPQTLDGVARDTATSSPRGALTKLGVVAAVILLAATLTWVCGRT